MEPTSQRLYDLGQADLETRFNPAVQLVHDPFRPDRHMPHHTLWYAYYLLEQGDTEQAEAIIEKVLSTQETRPNDPHYGNFHWHWEDEVVIDLNACQFVLEALTTLPREKLSTALRERVHTSMRLALNEAERLDVHWTYTNIHLLDIRNRILGGQLLGDESIVRRGSERLKEWAHRTREVGAPHEFNSATYAAVDLNCLAAIARHAGDADARTTALDMEHLVWRHVAQHWHAPTMQLAGPYSRSYRRDVVGASGYLKTVLYKILGDERLLAKTPYYEGPDSEGQLVVALTDYHCPPDAEKMFRTPDTRRVHERVAVAPETRTTAYITPSFSLGTMSRPYGVGEPPEPWPANDSCIAYWTRDEAPGYGVLYCRYRVNSAPAGEPSWNGVPASADIWEEGVFRTAQIDGKAIVAYGLMPRGQRPVHSLRLDIRMLGTPPDYVHIDRKTWNGEPLVIPAGCPVIFGEAATLCAIVPLTPTDLGENASITLWRDGDETVLSIANYEGPPKVFWEYRSLSGPFWKGNLKNGFVIWMAGRDEWRALDDFYDTLRSTPVGDEQQAGVRRVQFGDVSLEYDLRDMWP